MRFIMNMWMLLMGLVRKWMRPASGMVGNRAARCLCVMLAAFWVSPAALRAQEAPAVKPGGLYRMTYLTAEHDFSHGYAFLLRVSNGQKRYMVSPHHSLGKEAGLPFQIPPDTIDKMFAAVVAVGQEPPHPFLRLNDYLFIPDVRPTDKRGADKDLCIFRVPTEDAPGAGFELRKTPVRKGDTLWLYTKFPDTHDARLHKVVVAWESANEIRYHFKDSETDLKGLDGSPLLDADGKVAVMHQGFFKSPSGYLFGFGTPARSIYKATGW